MADQIRVLRILEYIFADVDQMEGNMSRWTTSMELPGRMKMRTVHLNPTGVESLPPPPPALAVRELTNEQLSEIALVIEREQQFRRDNL